MKKLYSLLAVLLCAAMMAAPASAASDAGAYKLYQKAMARLQAADSFAIKGDVKLEFAAGGVSMEVPARLQAQVVNQDGKLQTGMTMEVDGTVGNQTAYYRDGYMYRSSGASKVKTKVGEQSLEDLLDIKLTQEMFGNASVEQVEDGSRITIKISGKEALADFENPFYLTAAGNTDIAVRSATYTILLDERGSIKSYRRVVNGKGEANGAEVSMKFTQTYRLSSLNKISGIDFPADLASYR